MPTLRKHKNVGNTFASFDNKNEVLEYLSEVAHSSGESQATRFVRELTGIGVRDEERNGVTLPAFYSKRKMYEEFCFINGWKVKSDNRGVYPRLKDYPEQPFDDENGDMALWPTGSIKNNYRDAGFDLAFLNIL